MNKKLFHLIVVCFLSAQALNAQIETSNLIITDGISNEALKKTIEKNVSGFLYACNAAVIKDKTPDLDKSATTGDARKRFMLIWKSSPMACAVSSLERKCLTRPSGGGYQIRNIPVTMYEAPEDKQNQEIVINLTADGKIDDVFIPVTQYTDLINANQVTEDPALRLMVLDFVENYRTAYNRKDIKFIESVFSNNAIIIVGNQIRQKPKSDAALRNSLTTTGFEYQVKDKTRYITDLQGIFKRSKYFDIQFSEIMVLQHENYPQVYGVTLKQVWNSSRLKNDVGYVFLLIDFRDINQPLIHVRTWQPEKYDNGTVLRRDEVFQIGHFDLNRF